MDFAQRSRCLKWLGIKGLWPTDGDYQAAFESLPLRHKKLKGYDRNAVTLLCFWLTYKREGCAKFGQPSLFSSSFSVFSRASTGMLTPYLKVDTPTGCRNFMLSRFGTIQNQSPVRHLISITCAQLKPQKSRSNRDYSRFGGFY